MRQPIINNGLNLGMEKAEQDGSEYRFGALSQPGLATIPLEQKEMYLPKGEVQRGIEDFQDCASRAPVNALEGQFTWLAQNKKLSTANLKWLQDNGYITPEGRVEFSDRWIAVKSGTTKEGNSLIAPLRAIRDYGLIPKSLLPRDPTFTFDQYHDKSKLTPKMAALGKEFKARFEINYDQVFTQHLAEALKDDFVDVAAYAWPFPENGVYPRSDYQMNHAFILYGLPRFQAFDNYEEAPEDFTKNLAPDYLFFDYGYRIFISVEKKSAEDALVLSLWQQLIVALEQLRDWLATQEPKVNGKNDRLYDVAYTSIGQDISPMDEAPDDLACANSLSKVIQKAFPELRFPNLISTIGLYNHFIKSPSFRAVGAPVKGDIILSVTGTGNGKVSNGHTGIVGKTWIMSNDSRTGFWEANYTMDGWRRYFETKGGMATLFFRRV